MSLFDQIPKDPILFLIHSDGDDSNAGCRDDGDRDADDDPIEICFAWASLPQDALPVVRDPEHRQFLIQYRSQLAQEIYTIQQQQAFPQGCTADPTVQAKILMLSRIVLMLQTQPIVTRELIGG